MKIAVVDSSFSSFKIPLEQIISNIDNSGKTIYNGSRNVVKLFPIEDKKLVVKGFKPPNVINKIVYRFFRKSKAERSFIYAQKLKSLSIGTPTPIAFYENFSGLFFLDSYYVSEFQESDLTFRELITNPEFPERDKILKQFTAFTKKLHDNDILFMDHSPGNTLIKKTSAGEYEFYLVDLNRMKFKKLNFRERIQNFSRLTPCREMVRIMADTYAGLCGFDKEKTYSLMWRETQKFQEKFHRKRRLKRRIFFWKEKYKT